MTSNLEWLQQYYLSLCNGDWEHGEGGCDIGNCDNPGWIFKFELADTVYEGIDFPEIRNGADVVTDGPDWVFLKRNGTAIEGACGPLKLDELIGEFRKWVDAVEPQAATIEREWQANAED